ncbi:MAG: hypothetical protein Q8N19_12770 [Phenylobacterium sp.]|uniref:hypothetical protein n=1 Tax=Phenylobacterium sp. TaxID=1871053 RepID=UPI002735FEC9|nr:hypothetical protein [Phenylobacterium sp.]MDP3117974.1 hypothetical protein [Phenylobacterium sp.]
MEWILTRKRHLPSEDLANIATLPIAEQRKRLVGLLGPARMSYRPVRLAEGAIWGLGLPLPIATPKPTTDDILAAVAAQSRKGEERRSCLELARLFHELVLERSVVAASREFGRLQLGMGVSVSYCSDVVLLQAGEAPSVVGVNYRRRPYTAGGLRFALSAMHEQSRALERDLSGARLSMLQFPQRAKRPRTAEITFGDGIELFDYEQLARMAADTCRLWNEVQEAAEDKARRTDTSGWWGYGEPPSASEVAS